MKAKKSEKKVLYSSDPEWYGFEYDRSRGDYVLREDGEKLLWEDLGWDMCRWGHEALREVLPEPGNDYLVENLGWPTRAYRTPYEAVEAALGRPYGEFAEVVVEDGDLYAGGHLIRELTDRGQEWFYAHKDSHALYGSDAGQHCLDTRGMTRKVFGTGAPKARSPARKPAGSARTAPARRKAARTAKHTSGAGRSATVRPAATSGTSSNRATSSTRARAELPGARNRRVNK